MNSISSWAAASCSALAAVLRWLGLLIRTDVPRVILSSVSKEFTISGCSTRSFASSDGCPVDDRFLVLSNLQRHLLSIRRSGSRSELATSTTAPANVVLSEIENPWPRESLRCWARVQRLRVNVQAHHRCPQLGQELLTKALSSTRNCLGIRCFQRRAITDTDGSRADRR